MPASIVGGSFPAERENGCEALHRPSCFPGEGLAEPELGPLALRFGGSGPQPIPIRPPVSVRSRGAPGLDR